MSTLVEWLNSPAVHAAPTSWAEILGFATGTLCASLVAEQHVLNLVCDTDAFATTVWEHRNAGPASRGAERAVGGSRPEKLYLVTDHLDVPFVQDGWRDVEHVRQEMTAWFLDRLTQSGRSWVLLTGSSQERLELAVRVTDQTLLGAARFADTIGVGSPGAAVDERQDPAGLLVR